MMKNFKCDIGSKILLSKCSDHETTFLDTYNKIPPDRHIYASKTMVETRFQTPKSSSTPKVMLGFAAYGSLTIYFKIIYNYILYM